MLHILVIPSEVEESLDIHQNTVKQIPVGTGVRLAYRFDMKSRRAFRRALLKWYRRNGRDLPWRRTRDPYAVLVSELMLQQTQVKTVLPYYQDWLRRFPNFASLARASERAVLHAWQGLGYYARARNLRAAAKIVQRRHRGRFPRDPDRILELPGVGRYIANAVATFAFDQPVPIVETNTARVLARLFNIRKRVDSAAAREKLWRCASDLVPKRHASHFNSALTDLGALVCLPRTPRCTLCPVRRFCRAPNPEKLPFKRSRPTVKRITEDHSWLVRQKRILLEQSRTRWHGMWILPSLKLANLGPSRPSKPIHVSYFPFTHHRVRLRVFLDRLRKIRAPYQRWIPVAELDSIPIPSPHRRAIEQLLSGA